MQLGHKSAFLLAKGTPRALLALIVLDLPENGQEN
jgi:hypothetical protein